MLRAVTKSARYTMIIIRDAFVVLVIIIMTLSAKVHAASDKQIYYRNFWSPEFHAQKLSYCDYDGKICGDSIANEYCQKMGYRKSEKSIIANNVGLTRYINKNAECKGWECNGFKLIKCEGKISQKPPKRYSYRYRRFSAPRVGHYRIGWCYQEGAGCGKRAAQSFCRRMGYMKTSGYEKEPNVHATKALGDQKLCFGSKCDGFGEITCYR